ncbi:MAG: hypothetical protein EZS28_015279, partial [Streblomastix strix]
ERIRNELNPDVTLEALEKKYWAQGNFARYYRVQLLILFITRLPYLAVMTGCSHELSIAM